jgi:GntR family transcriptional regulator of arabinose operon
MVSVKPPQPPLYRQLSERLRREISTGTREPGERLPSERDLAATHELSLNTVRQALQLLQEDGLVERRHGAGTFVLDPAVRHGPALVGVIVPTVKSFFGEIVLGIEDGLRSEGHRMLLYCAGYDAEREREALREARAAGVDGLLMAPSLHMRDAALRARYVDELREARRGLPTVYVERRVPDDDAEYVSSDPVAGAALAVGHLHRLGRRRIAFLGPTRSAPSEPIYEGYRRGLADWGLAEDPALVRRTRDWGRRPEEDDDAVRALMAEDAPPDGILCLGDHYAFRVYYVLRELGRRVPEDVSLVAYDDVVASLLEVPLTAVSPPKYEVGRQGAALLSRRLAEGDATPIQQIVLKPRLVVRATCGGVPAVEVAGATREPVAELVQG